MVGKDASQLIFYVVEIQILTNRSRVTYICVSNLLNIN